MVSTVKPVKFTRDSGFLAHDEFLVIFIKEDLILISIYMYIFAIVLLLDTVYYSVLRSLCAVFPVLN